MDLNKTSWHYKFAHLFETNDISNLGDYIIKIILNFIMVISLCLGIYSIGSLCFELININITHPYDYIIKFGIGLFVIPLIFAIIISFVLYSSIGLNYIKKKLPNITFKE